MEPGIEPVRVTQGRKLSPSADECFLDGVLGEVGRPEDEASDGVQTIAGRSREDFERLVVSPPCRLDEIAPHSICISGTNFLGRAASYDGRRSAGYSKGDREPVRPWRRLAG